jgi:predicted dehydrogenase
MSNPRRVLVVGTGSIGERHVRCFQATDRVTVSLCETNADLRRWVAGKYQVDHVFSDLDAALAEPPDVGVIATPAHLHIPMAIKLANAVARFQNRRRSSGLEYRFRWRNVLHVHGASRR